MFGGSRSFKELFGGRAAVVRCGRCGLPVRVIRTGRRKLLKVKAEAWSARCKNATSDAGPVTPFECPDLRAATSRSRPATPTLEPS
jgi:hypothetical protein